MTMTPWQLRAKENLHIVFWLFKDFCWLMLYKPLGMMMVFPTVFLAFYLSWKSRHLRSELFHNLAVTSWILGNSIWMAGEFYFDDTTRPLASVFFYSGIGFVLYFYITEWLQQRTTKQQSEAQ